jgi:hypothetical protein
MMRIRRIKIVQVERRLTASAAPLRGKCPVCGQEVDTIATAEAQELLEVGPRALDARPIGCETHSERDPVCTNDTRSDPLEQEISDTAPREHPPDRGDSPVKRKFNLRRGRSQQSARLRAELTLVLASP